jgi:hypothetical protein
MSCAKFQSVVERAPDRQYASTGGGRMRELPFGCHFSGRAIVKSRCPFTRTAWRVKHDQNCRPFTHTWSVSHRNRWPRQNELIWRRCLSWVLGSTVRS